MEKFSINDWLDIQDAVEKAREDDTPYAIHQRNGDLAIVGDANKTEKKPSFDYDAKFRYEKKELNSIPKGAQEVGRFIVFEHHFDDININPRNDLQLVESSLGVFPILKAFSDIVEKYEEKAKEIDPNVQFVDGNFRSEEHQDELKKMAKDRNIELIHVYNEAGDSGQLSIYKFVQTLLNIDDDLISHMMPISVLGILMATIVNNPEIINEAETVFGY